MKFEICNAVIPHALAKSTASDGTTIRAVFGLKRGHKGVDICLAFRRIESIQLLEDSDGLEILQ